MPVPSPPVVAWLPPVPSHPVIPLRGPGSSSSALGGIPTEDGNCELLGSVGLLVQALMGVLVIATLLVKRSLEHPKRPWKIWALDNSKQFLGQAIVHTSNILISTFPAPSPPPHLSSTSSLLSKPSPIALPPNPCSLYFLNVLIDTTLGVFLIYYLLRLARWVLVEKMELEGWEMGVYKEGRKGSCWAKQSAVFVSALLVMKGSVVVIFAIIPGIFRFGSWVLSWLDPHGQVVFVMAIFPLAMNILQFTLLDTILRHSSPPSSLPSSSTSTHPTAHSRDRSTAYASLPTSDTPRSPILTANLDAYSTSTSTPGSPRTALSPRPGGLLRQRSGSVCSADGERFNAGVGANGLGLHGVDGGEEEMRVGGGGVGGPEGKGKEE